MPSRARIEQTLPTFDTALVDDCFHYRDAPLLPSLAERRGEHGDVTVLSNETDRGQAASLNEAISAAQTRVAVLDLPLVLWRSDSPVDAGRHS